MRLISRLAGDAACAACLTRCPSCSTGTRLATSLVTDGNAPSSTTLSSSLLRLQSTWSDLHSLRSTSSSLTSVILLSNPVSISCPDPLLPKISWHSFVGMVATATRTILENLDRIPDEDGRTKVAIVCYDTSLYFFSLPVRLLPLS